MDKIRVVHITKNMVINGISTVILSYCENMNLDKYEITIVAGNPVDSFYKQRLNQLGIKIIEIEEKTKKPFSNYVKLFSLLLSCNYDIAHIHGNSHTITVELLLCLLSRVKIRIAHCHSISCNHMLIHKLLRFPFDVLYTKGLACSYEAGIWMFGQKRFDVIPNGVNIEKYRYCKKERDEIRSSLAVANNYVLGHIGRFILAKNQVFLLDVLVEVLYLIPNAKLLLVGEGPLIEKIKNEVKIRQLDKSVIFYGATEKPELLYNAMDVFLMPSLYEGLGIVAMESQINGLPTICSVHVPKSVNISDNIQFYTLNSAKVWAKRIKEISEHSIRTQNGLKEEKIAQIDQRKISKKIEEIYEEMLKGGVKFENN